MKVVFADRPDKASLFARLATHLRESKCASDRSGIWSPHAKAEKAAMKWATDNGLVNQAVSLEDGTRAVHIG